MKTLFLIIGIVVFGFDNAQTPNWQWANTAGSTGLDCAGGDSYHTSAISTDELGNSYITGLFNGSATFGTVGISTPAIHQSVFVAKYDVNGNCMWVKGFGGSVQGGGNEGTSVDLDSLGNCYVTGTFQESAGVIIPFGTSTLTGTGHLNIFIAKYDSNGNELWIRQPLSSAPNTFSTGPENDFAKSIATDKAGNSYITGWLGVAATHTFGNNIPISGTGCFAAKYDASGTAVWSVKVGDGIAGGSAVDGLCIDVDGNGKSFVSGYLQGTNTFVTIPAATLTSIGDRDVFVAKIGTTGTINWVKQLSSIPGLQSSNSSSYCKGISIDGTGNVFLSGDFNKGVIIGTTTLITSSTVGSENFIAKFDNNGNPLWARASTGINSGGAAITSVKVSANGYCYITGEQAATTGTATFCGMAFPNTNGYTSVYALKIDPNGAGSWGLFSGVGDCHPGGISIDDSSNVYISGMHADQIAFGSHTISTYGNVDVFVAKINYAGAPSGTTTAINQETFVSEPSVSIYPNPFNTSAILEIKGYKVDCPLQIQICNLLGQEVKRVNNIFVPSIMLSRDNLPKGIYTYQLLEKERLLRTGKLVIE